MKSRGEKTKHYSAAGSEKVRSITEKLLFELENTIVHVERWTTGWRFRKHVESSSYIMPERRTQSVQKDVQPITFIFS